MCTYTKNKNADCVVIMYSVISDAQLNLNITVNDLFCGQVNDAPGLGAKIEVMCPGPLTGTFVKIQRTDNIAFKLAEVQPIFTDDGC